MAQWVKPECLALPTLTPQPIPAPSSSAHASGRPSGSGRLAPIATSGLARSQSVASEAPSLVGGDTMAGAGAGAGAGGSAHSAQPLSTGALGPVPGEGSEVTLPLSLFAVIDNSDVELSPWAYPADLQASRVHHEATGLHDSSSNSISLGTLMSAPPTSPAALIGPSGLGRNTFITDHLAAQHAEQPFLDLASASGSVDTVGAGRSAATSNAQLEISAALNVPSRQSPDLRAFGTTSRWLQQAQVAAAQGPGAGYGASGSGSAAVLHGGRPSVDSARSAQAAGGGPATGPTETAGAASMPDLSHLPSLYHSPARGVLSSSQLPQTFQLGGRTSGPMPHVADIERDRGSNDNLLGPTMAHLGRLLGGSSIHRGGSWAVEDEGLEEGPDDEFVVEEVRGLIWRFVAWGGDRGM